MSAEMKLSKIALGAWVRGNDGTFGNNFTAESRQPIFDTAMANGLNFWDTAYAYGTGCGNPSMTKNSRHMKAAYQLGKSL